MCGHQRDARRWLPKPCLSSPYSSLFLFLFSVNEKKTRILRAPLQRSYGLYEGGSASIRLSLQSRWRDAELLVPLPSRDGERAVPHRAVPLTEVPQPAGPRSRDCCGRGAEWKRAGKSFSRARPVPPSTHTHTHTHLCLRRRMRGTFENYFLSTPSLRLTSLLQEGGSSPATRRSRRAPPAPAHREYRGRWG